MANPYRAVLAEPGAAAFVGAGLLARLPMSMIGIGIVLAVHGTGGSYGRAGIVTGVFDVVQAVCSPQVSRLVDRHGQARVMRPAIAVHVVAVLALVLLAAEHAPLLWLCAAATVMGATFGSLGALVRARWSYVLARRQAAGRAGERVEAAGERLHTAYSLESVLDEVVFMVGPLLVALLGTQVAPPAGLIAAAVAIAVGGYALFAQRGTEPPPASERPAASSGVLRAPGMVALVVVMAFVGAMFGAVEVITVAFTAERGEAGATGLVLAAYALGSLVAGLGYGAVRWRSSAARRFLVGQVAMALLLVPVALATTVPVLALGLFVAGVAISPTIISGNALVQELVVPARLTEGLTWLSTGLGIGVSAGAAVAGQIIDAAGAQRALLLPVACGGVAALLALACARVLNRPPLA